MNGIDLELFRHRFAAIPEEMGEQLTRTAFSPNIKERRDHSCALFDADANMIALAAHIPVHLGATPLCVRAVLDALSLTNGQTAIVNDPYAGGTHLPDITLVTAIDVKGARFYVTTRAHHADVGGITAGSLPLSRTIDDEGWRVGPTLLSDTVARDLFAHSRTPHERRGDLAAQRAACELGAKRTRELVAQHGVGQVVEAARSLLDYTERRTRAALRSLPNGEVSIVDLLDDASGVGPPIPIRLTLRVHDGEAVFDFRGCAPQVSGPLNAVRSITESAVLYGLLILSDGDLPHNSGAMRCARVLTRPATVVDARYPAAVAAGNVETSQRLVDVILQAFGRLVPGRFAASSCGSMNNVLVGAATSDCTPFAYYETLAGGHGGSPIGPGLSARHAHMTNTANTPVEALEHAFPFLVTRYAIRRGSGGAGVHRGGDGVEREMTFLSAAEVTLLGERRRFGAPGVPVGPAAVGETGEHALTRDGVTTALAGKVTLRVRAGDVVTVRTPGGGGWSPP